MKMRIPKGSVQVTLLIPLYGRRMAMDLYPDLFSDRDCRELLEKIDFEAPKMSGIQARIGAVMAATRQYDMAAVCRAYLRTHPNAAVVNLGCGLDTTFSQVDNGTASGYRELDRRYGLIANTIFRFVDKSNMCQIIEIGFQP